MGYSKNHNNAWTHKDYHHKGHSDTTNYDAYVKYYNCSQTCGESSSGSGCSACNTACQVCNTCESSCQHQGQLVSSQKNLANYITYDKTIDLINIDDNNYEGANKIAIDHRHWNELINYINAAADYVNNALDQLLIQHPAGLTEYTTLDITKAKIAYKKESAFDKDGKETNVTITDPWKNLPKKKESELITSADFKKVNEAIKLFKNIQDEAIISENEITQNELQTDFETQQPVTRVDFKKLVTLMNETAGVPNLVPCCEKTAGEYCIKCDVNKLI